MRVKRLIACLLTAATLAGLLAAAPASAAGKPGFTDITDPATADAAEMLRLLEVVDGTGGGAFNPGRTLSRAEFCKMAVEIMGWGDEEPGHRNRTIFQDVGPTYWARGYINLASTKTLGGSSDKENSSGGTRLIRGVGDGTFQPERPITYGEAVAILMRVLGYSDADVATGANWYDGYVAVAKSSGLADGLSLTGGAAITRGQAAILFYNLLFTESKGSKEIYLTTLGGKKQDGGILLDVNATAGDGTLGAVKTTTGTYKTDRAPLSAALLGLQGEVVLDKDGKLLAFQPKKDLTKRSVSVSKWSYNKVTTSGGEELSIDPDSVVYQDGEKKVYKDIWQNLKPSTPVTIYYTSDGKVDYLFLQSAAAAESSMVARNKPSGTVNPFRSLTGGVSDYFIYKNGVPATVADLRQYDVATYDSASKILNISDLRLSGVYENVYPNTDTPATVQMLGAQFNVLPEAAKDLRSFKIGDAITLLFTRDGQVAGVVSASAAKSTAIGVVSEITAGSGNSSGTAKITLLNDIIGPLTGKVGVTADGAKRLKGQLVTVSSRTVGYLSLTQLSERNTRDALDVGNQLLGKLPLAENIKLFERVDNGAPVEIELDQLTCNTVPADKILYVEKDYADKVSLLVLDDVTGDLYTYGFLSSSSEALYDSDGKVTGSNPLARVKTDGKTAKDGWTNKDLELYGTIDVRKDTPGGLASSPNVFTGRNTLASYVTLTPIYGVRRSDFDMEAKTVATTDMVLPISPHVVCWNSTTETWFSAADPMDALEQARAYSDDITLYYDKAPDQGGKVRMVVVQ